MGILNSITCTIPIQSVGSNFLPHSFFPNERVELVFRVEIPFRKENRSLYLDILDEVTGLALNPNRYQLNQEDSTHYSMHLLVTKGSSLKYRYLLGGTPPLVEYKADGKQVRYRGFYVTEPSEINDLVIAWQDMPYQGPKGWLRGQVIDEQDNAPLADMVVLAGGYQTVTQSDGTFEIKDLPIGTHIVNVFSKHGDYLPFQQGALIAPESLTPAIIKTKKLNLVNVQFNVKMPDNFDTTMPIRMVGNIVELGNAFDDLRGGVNIIVDKAPVMQKINGKYFLSIKLPSGLDLRYKYTLGDGFWNAELDPSGKFQVRQLIVPDHDTVVDDVITAWLTPGIETITFNVTTPKATTEVVISLQLNPYGWMEPIPMISIGENSWSYTLFGPLNLFDQASYRYCYNNLCETNQGESLTEIRSFSPSISPQTFIDVIEMGK